MDGTPHEFADATELPTIAAVVGVCDENELMARCIGHLEAQHVSSIVVVDNGSVDGTRDILRRLQAESRVALIETEGDPHKDIDYFARGIRLAKDRFHPDWILVQDADEFWLHRSGDLRRGVADVAALSMTVQRFNACVNETLMRFVNAAAVDAGELDLFVEPLRLTRAKMEDDRSLRWVAAQPVDKVITRAAVLVDVTTGGHAAIGPEGCPVPSSAASDFLIVHAPFLTLPRFERKVRNAKAVIARCPDAFPGSTAWHWKRWIELMDGPGLEAEFAGQQIGQDTLAAGRGSGAIRSACQVFLERR